MRPIRRWRGSRTRSSRWSRRTWQRSRRSPPSPTETSCWRPRSRSSRLASRRPRTLPARVPSTTPRTRLCSDVSSCSRRRPRRRIRTFVRPTRSTSIVHMHHCRSPRLVLTKCVQAASNRCQGGSLRTQGAGSGGCPGPVGEQVRRDVEEVCGATERAARPRGVHQQRLERHTCTLLLAGWKMPDAVSLSNHHLTRGRPLSLLFSRQPSHTSPYLPTGSILSLYGSICV